MPLEEREGVVVALDGVAARQGAEAAVDRPPRLHFCGRVRNARQGLPVPVRRRSRDYVPPPLAVLGVEEAGVVRADLRAGVEGLRREGVDVRDMRREPGDRRGVDAADLGGWRGVGGRVGDSGTVIHPFIVLRQAQSGERGGRRGLRRSWGPSAAGIHMDVGAWPRAADYLGNCSQFQQH